MSYTVDILACVRTTVYSSEHYLTSPFPIYPLLEDRNAR